MKTLVSGIVAVLLLSTGLIASDGASLARLLQQEQKLAQKVEMAYMQGKPYQDYLAELKKIQRQVRAKADHREAATMAEFLDFCIVNLEKTVKQPRNKDNTQIVSDLDKSICEGCQYLSRLDR